MHKSEAENHRIFGARFVDTIKNEGTPNAFEKSRLVIQAFNDKLHGLLTHAPTVQRSSQRLLFALAAILPEWKVMSRDVSQAYTQSKSPLKRPIYVQPLPEFGLSDDMVLKVECPLYGIPEAGVHWFVTYQKHHIERLGMQPASHDFCLLYTPNSIAKYYKNSKTPHGITCLQTDDTMTLANPSFISLEQKESMRFESKPLQYLRKGEPLKFNGALLTLHDDHLTLTAPTQVEKLSTISTKEVSKDEFVSQRSRGAYIASVCRPDTSFGFGFAAQHVRPETKQARELNKSIEQILSAKDYGLKFVKLDIKTLYFAVFVDSSFANNPDFSSQLGYVLCLMDADNNANIVHYSSLKSKRITRSVLAAELYAMVHGFDHGCTILDTIRKFIGNPVPLRIYTDSKCLFDSLHHTEYNI